MKSKIAYCIALSIVTFLFSSCTKTNPKADGDTPQSENLLMDPATGWERVAVIPFSGLGGGATPYNGMRGFDLQKTAGKFVVLYTQHSNDPVVHSAADYFYKALVSENTTADVTEISFGIFSNGGVSSPFTYYGQFIADSYTPAFTGIDYTNNYIELRDKEGDTYAGAPAANYPTFKYTADGEFIAGSLWAGHESFLWHHKSLTDPIGDFGSTYRPGVIDGNKRLFNIPFKSTDGNYYEFSLCAKDGQVTFLTIRCREDIPYGATPPNYEITDWGTVAGLPVSGYSADFMDLLTYDYNAATGEVTFVIDDYQSSASGSDGRKNLYCYRWKQGSFNKLWQVSLEDDTDFRNAIRTYSNKNMLNEWRLKPDGTFYLMCPGLDGTGSYSGPGIKLWEVNDAGIKLLSSLTEAQTAQKSIHISTCRYIDGVYYALAYPIGDGIYKIGDPRFHMEIIKLAN